MDQTVSLPMNLGLNDGTYCAQACVDVMKRFDKRTSLRNYTDGANQRVLNALAEHDGVGPENIYLANGSGPILKQAMSLLIEQGVKGSVAGVLKHLAKKSGYPIITPTLTYFKVPIAATGKGLALRWVPLTPETDFALDMGALEAQLKKGPGLVYIASPNNPTGNVLIRREQLIPLLDRYPKHTFWIDEAYVQYADPTVHTPVADLVPKYRNLVVARTFSFAYGLAGVRIGYLLARPDFIRQLEDQVVNYRLGELQEELVLASLADTEHLPWLRQICAGQRKILCDAINAMPGLEAFPQSIANFVLCRTTDGQPAKTLTDPVEAAGIHLKTFADVADQTYPEYFRITLGLAAENLLLIGLLEQANKARRS
jgi:histidinol-phosphate aminotransferase